MTDPRRDLPSVDRLLQEPAVAALLEVAPRGVVVEATRQAIAVARRGRAGVPTDWAADIAERTERLAKRSLHPVLNATGVVLHTNLGRAPLAAAAVEAMAAVASGYSTLEFDLQSGARGQRTDHGRRLLAELTGSEDALVVNNAAGALVLALNTLAAGSEVIVSRGELVEIGGSFRIPDILARSGARLREVGTTNRTHLADYRDATGPATGAILSVHRSNFEQVGFTAAPSTSELAALARANGIPFLHDNGSGLLADLSGFGLDSEPSVSAAVASGADLVAFSGDKLLGGPQAGCLVGRRDLLDRCRKNAMARALRADKLTFAALEATLAIYRDPDTALREVPVLRMLTLGDEELRRRAERLTAAIRRHLRGVPLPTVVPGHSVVGGGAFPGAQLPTSLVALTPDARGAAALALALRLGEPAVIARVEGDLVLLDPRTLPESSLDAVAASVAGAYGE